MLPTLHAFLDALALIPVEEDVGRVRQHLSDAESKQLDQLIVGHPRLAGPALVEAVSKTPPRVQMSYWLISLRLNHTIYGPRGTKKLSAEQQKVLDKLLARNGGDAWATFKEVMEVLKASDGSDFIAAL